MEPTDAMVPVVNVPVDSSALQMAAVRVCPVVMVSSVGVMDAGVPAGLAVVSRLVTRKGSVSKSVL